MASSEAEICSDALVLIGAKPITALTENTREARLCARLYPKTLQEVLRMAPWACARKEQQLNQDDPPSTLFTFTYSYQLPIDCIRVWGTDLDKVWGGSGWTWQIQGRKLVTDATTIKILYVHRITDVLLFDTLLEKALAYDLASKLAYPISQMRDIQDTFDKMRQRACNQAMTINTQEQTKSRFMSTSLTTEVR
jgi:hypothetical protein